MDLGIRNRVALVTGASRGIGAVIATTLAAEGAHVVVGYHSAVDDADSVVQNIVVAGGEASPVRFDHRDPVATRAALGEVQDRLGALQIVVTNAGGFPQPGPFGSLSDEAWRAALQDQLEGPGNVIRSALPQMTDSGWGRIVLISTVHAAVGNPGVVAHTAAKSGLHGLTRSLARELGSAGILVNAVLPGLTLTSEALKRFPPERIAASRSAIPTQRASTPEDIATLVAFLASARNGNITGETIRSAGGV